MVFRAGLPAGAQQTVNDGRCIICSLLETRLCPVSHRLTKIVEGASQPGGPHLDFDPLSSHIRTSLVAQMVNCPPAMWGTRVHSPASGRSPWRRKWQPTPVLLPGKSHGRRSLVGYIQSMGLQRVGRDGGTSLTFHVALEHSTSSDGCFPPACQGLYPPGQSPGSPLFREAHL